MNIILPALFAVQQTEHHNTIRQIVCPPWSGEAAIETYTRGRARGFKITRTGSPPVVCITNSSKPDANLTHVLRLVGLTLDPSSPAPIDLSKAKWIQHEDHNPRFVDLEAHERNVERVRDSWIGAFNYKREDQDRRVEGLRPPQIGAVYGVLSHWTSDTEPATVVIPTGVGKTETMLSLLVADRCKRLLVVVPTDALRTQISEKFLSLGLLKDPRFQIVSDKARYPVVGILNRRPTSPEQVDSLFRKCNVVVTTMPLAGQCAREVATRMAHHCTCLFIDEAHHVAAPTWKAFKDIFKETKIVQFTATPFRNDDQPIGGKRVFTFSLRHAQEQQYFKQIQFKPVTEFDPFRKDRAIAEAAVEQLRAEAQLGHILMARVASVSRAKEVFECYRQYAEFNPVQIHSGIKSKAELDQIRRDLLSGKIRIVVCVDMLGEGFDLPELKIAAFHDIRKTLAVTLQLVGRFTRTKPSLGNATFIANIADLEVKDELRRLYQHDSDWNVLLPLLNENVTKGELNLWEFLGGFKELPDSLTLRNVRPAMSAVAYQTRCKTWAPGNFSAGIRGYDSLDRVYHTINPQENTLVIVTTQRVPVDWAKIDEIHNWDWQLYVLHWDQTNGLLFIHNSSNAGFFRDLARAVCGEDVEQIRGPTVFRCLSGVTRLKLQNVGLLEQLGRLIRYTMRAGSDVEPGMSEAQKQKAIKANLFGQGFENGHRSSIGCSYRGRIWSYQTTNLLQLTKWCRSVGARLIDDSLDPEQVLNGTLVPVLIPSRPSGFPISVEWPDVFYREREQAFSFNIQGQTVYRHEVDLAVIDPSATGPLKFALSSGSSSAVFELSLFERGGIADYSIQAQGSPDATIQYHGKQMKLQEFFEEDPPTFWFADGSSLSGNEHVALRIHPKPFPKARISVWDWSGTSLRIESQGPLRNAKAIQYRVVANLKLRPFSVIFDDDDAGEAADVVAVLEEKEHIEVEFWHCKYARADTPGSRIEELYQVCGQAQNSVRWLEKPRDLFTHLLRRNPRRLKGKETTRYEIGTEEDLLRIREKAGSQQIFLRIFIVQPGLSKAAASKEQLELLAVTENYLLETFAVPLGIIGNA